MSLKCQFCGKELLYDRKICQSCEDRAISSGLRFQDDHKWRCDNFLDSSGLAFGCNLDKSKLISLKMIKCFECGEEYSYGRNIYHNCEGKSLTFGKIFEPAQKTYRWNCNTAMTCLDLMTSEVDRIETIVKEPPHLEKLEKTDYKWNEISTIQYNKIEIDRKKGLLIYE